MLAQTALKPELREVCCEITPPIEGISWSKGIWFVCGARATPGELRDNNFAKHLRCGQCGTDWHFRRQQCAHCGNEDHRTLRFLYAEGHLETMRVEACNNCRGYLKVITSFGPTPPEMLILEELATLHLDNIAQNRGYIRRDVQYAA